MTLALPGLGVVQATGAKQCRRCGRTLPFSEFYRNRKSADGLQRLCKACLTAANEANARWRKNHPPPRVEPTVIEKTCTDCLRLLPRASFDRAYRSKDGLRHYCRECTNERNRERYRRDPEVKKAANRRWNEKNPEAYVAMRQREHMKGRYDLTAEEYEALLVAQHGLCAICKRPPKEGTRLAVDHDHRTDRVRGLLHRKCNTAIGHLNDDPVLVRAALEYLLRAR